MEVEAIRWGVATYVRVQATLCYFYIIAVETVSMFHAPRCTSRTLQTLPAFRFHFQELLKCFRIHNDDVKRDLGTQLLQGFL